MGVCLPTVLRHVGAFFTTAQAVLHHLPQADSSPCPTGILHHGVSRSFSQIPRAQRAEFWAPSRGGSVIARRVSAGYPGGEILEPRVRGGRKPRFGVWASLNNKVLCILLCGGKSQYRSLVLCRPSTGAPILLYPKPDAYASGYWAIAPGRGSQIPFAALTLMRPTNCYLWGYQLKTLTERKCFNKVQEFMVADWNKMC